MSIGENYVGKLTPMRSNISRFSRGTIDKIVESASAINPRIHFIVGGFHLVTASDPDIEKIATALHDRFKVEYVAPGHCTGESAFTALKKAFGDHYLYAGLGTTLTLNSAVP